MYTNSHSCFLQKVSERHTVLITVLLFCRMYIEIQKITTLFFFIKWNVKVLNPRVRKPAKNFRNRITEFSETEFQEIRKSYAISRMVVFVHSSIYSEIDQGTPSIFWELLHHQQNYYSDQSQNESTSHYTRY